MFYVYIIYSENFDKYYKGFTTNPQKRIAQHNAGESRYTSNFIPWKIVFLQVFSTKREALIREKKIKKYSKDQILQLIKSPKNNVSNIKKNG